MKIRGLYVSADFKSNCVIMDGLCTYNTDAISEQQVLIIDTIKYLKTQRKS